MAISSIGDRTSRDGLMTAAALSVVPGLGQIYNGEARKGLLFFCAGAANAGFLLLICVKGFLIAGAHALGSSMHVRLNSAVIDCLHNLDMRSPQMLLLCLLLIAFTLFCLRDALETRRHVRNREIYANEVIAISEAASGSYIFHALMFGAMFLLVLFLFVPPDLKPQITEITFVPEQPKTEREIHSKLRSINKSENGGKASPKPVLDTPRKSQAPSNSSSRQTEQTQPKQKTENFEHKQSQVQAKPTQTKSESVTNPREAKKVEAKTEEAPAKTAPSPPTTPRPPVPHFAQSKPADSPTPLPQPSTNRAATATTTPTPVLQAVRTANTSTSNNSAPLPLLAMAPSANPNFSPAPQATNNAGKVGSSPAPAPASGHHTHCDAGGPPQPGIQSLANPTSGDSASRPSLSSGHPSHPGSSDGSPEAGPRPRTVPTGGGHGQPLAVGPVVAGVPKGAFDHGGPTAPGWEKDGPTGHDSEPSPDYAWYMQELQRRIKRSWFPPKAPESKKVIVTFTIHKDGEPSNVRIFHSSGDHLSDEAAIRAVEHAAPFRPLPPGSESTIDVQFTFDYNLFTSRSSGMKF